MNSAAQIIVAVAILVATATAGLLVWRKGFGKLTVKAGPVSLDLSAVERVQQRVERKVDQTLQHVAAVNHAVNNVPKGTPPMVERVGRLETRMDHTHKTLDWQTGVMQQLASHLGVSTVPPPEAPQ